MIPLVSARKAQIPTAGVTKFSTVSPAICAK